MQMNDSAASDANYVTSALELFAALGSEEAIVDGDSRFSYADTRAAVLGMAAVLRAHGVRPGAAVAAVTQNRYGSIFLQLALHLLGCRTGFVATYAPLRDQLDFLEYADADVLIHDSDAGAALIKEIHGRNAPPPRPRLGPGGARPALVAEMAARTARGPQPFAPHSA